MRVGIGLRVPAWAVIGASTLALAGCFGGGSATNSDQPTSAAPTVPATSPVAPTAPATSPAAPTATPARGVVVTVTNVIDGDTIDTTAGRVRLIGIDTPERGDCNYEPAADELLRVIAEQSDQVVLVRGGTDDTDRYDRLLRYVDTVGGRDLNLHMITSGYATARYDSQDGYPRHDREDAYRAADLTAQAQSC